jgi:endogenous inhibitor of DNA gyrase (YacG/DUF329 family)
MKCPTCKKSVPDPAPGAELPAFFPFCSDRCKLIDLGRWLDGKYQVPVVDREDKHGSAGENTGGEDDLRSQRRRR